MVGSGHCTWNRWDIKKTARKIFEAVNAYQTSSGWHRKRSPKECGTALPYRLNEVKATILQG